MGLKFNPLINSGLDMTGSSGGGGGVANVTASSPLSSTGGASPDISLDLFPTNTFAGFDSAGVLESVPGFNIDTTTGGMNENITTQPNGGSGFTLNNTNLSFDPLQNSPNENWNIYNIQAQFDINNSGFSQGTNGNSAQLLNLGFTHQGTGDIGALQYLTMSSNIGNGTDPITVKGVSFCFGFGNINANVTLDGSLQGYGFQPNINAAAVGTSNFSVNAFYDFPNINIPVNGYTSFNSGPTLFDITNNHNYTGINLNPTITTLTGNAGVSGFGMSGNITTMSATGSFQGSVINPNITTSHGNITGFGFSPTITGGDANLTGLQISPSGGATLNDPTGISVNMSGIISNNPQGIVGINSDSRVQISGTTSLTSGEGFQIGSRLAHLFHNTSGSPVTGTDSIGVNIAGDIWMEDDVADGPTSGIVGITTISAAPQVAVSPGKTVDTINSVLFGVSLPDPGSPTGGTVTNLSMAKIIPPLAAGGTLNITNLNAIKIEDGFAAAATNAWALNILDPLAMSHFEGNVDLGSLTLNGSTSGTLNISADPVTTTYSLIMPPAQGASGETLQNDGSGNLSWAAGGSGARAWSGAHIGGASTIQWYTTSAALVDPLNFDSSVALTEKINVNFGTVNGYGADSGSSALPGIIFTPDSAGTYFVKVSGTMYNDNGGGVILQLWDGTNIIDGSPMASQVDQHAYNSPVTMSGLVSAPNTSPITISIQIAKSGAGTSCLIKNTENTVALEWTIYKL